MELKEQTLSTEWIYRGRLIQVKKDTVRLENGAEAFREVVLHPGGVGVIAVDADGFVLMVRQFRYPYREPVLEIPAGKRENEEDPLVCGKRELREETGYRAEEYRSLGKLYPTPGYLDEVIHLFLATGLRQEGQDLDEDEFLEVERYPLAELVRMVHEGEIVDAKTQIAILKADILLREENK